MAINPVDTSSFTPAQLAAFNAANSLGSGVQTYNSTVKAPATTVQTPASQTPVAPIAQNTTPATPTVNVNVGQPTQTTAPTQTTQQKPQTTTQPAFNGSVVDLLNSAGQDSSYATRQQLAKQYGIQNYSGTAQQNTDLAKKYLEAYNQVKGTEAPQNGADARTAISGLLGNTPVEQGTPEQKFMDSYAGMSPVVKNLYDLYNQAFSSTNTHQSLTEEYSNLLKDQGIPALQTELMNVNNIMNGTEDDIRNEISNVGGFATESQVQALTAARNKTLIKQANMLQSQLQMKEDYVNQIMQLTQADRKEVNDELDRKLGFAQQISTLQTQMDNAARQNYQKIIDNQGYAGLANVLSGSSKSYAESIMGLPQGSLSSPSWLQVNGSAPQGNQPSSVQEYNFAKSQGYKGTFNQWLTEDANRKATSTGNGMLTQAQINATVNQIAGNFDNEQLVKDYNQASNALRGIESIDIKSGSPTDDMAFIYGFAKIMDPNSVVREGEYKTVQDYAQALVQKSGLNVQRLFDNKNFLTVDAKTKMLSTLQSRVAGMKQGYDQVASEYQRQIDDAYAGKQRTITNYTVTGNNADALAKLKSALPEGEILVSREQIDGRHYFYIKPSELWATDIKM